MSEPAKDSAAEMEDKSTNVMIGCGIVFIVIALGLVALREVRLATQSNSGGEYTDVEDEKAMAITMAQNFVKDRLKSPSSASFPWGFNEYRATKSSHGTWHVSGSVEAVNSYNAKLRKGWSVEMKREGTNWKLMSINIQD